MTPLLIAIALTAAYYAVALAIAGRSLILFEAARRDPALWDRRPAPGSLSDGSIADIAVTLSWGRPYLAWVALSDALRWPIGFAVVVRRANAAPGRDTAGRV